ncbi:MAG: LysM peptidoglycan-binding domain-containing protein [Candidatus Omnitrophota bacterium]
MKNLILCCILLAVFVMSGCVMRTYTTEMDRVDQEIYGNRGVIMGTPPAVEDTQQIRKTRTIYNLEVELPSGYKTSQEIKDRDLHGNRGYVHGGVTPEKEVYISEKGEELVSGSTRLSGSGLGSKAMPQIVYSEPSSENTSNGNEYYVVKKGDTLQKISEKFFKTTTKWKDIYEANKHILKTPDRIRPGQKLVIPKS